MNDELLMRRISALAEESRGLAPERHEGRTAACPDLASLAEGALSESERAHVARCAHCGRIRRGALRPERPPVVRFAAPALAVTVLVAGFFAWNGLHEPERFPAPAVAQRAVEPQPIEAPAAPAIRPGPATTPLLLAAAVRLRPPTARPRLLERWAPQPIQPAEPQRAVLAGPQPPPIRFPDDAGASAVFSALGAAAPPLSTL